MCLLGDMQVMSIEFLYCVYFGFIFLDCRIVILEKIDSHFKNGCLKNYRNKAVP